MAALFFSPIRGLSFIIIGVFLGVILGNFIGIVPYAYTPSRHFVCTLILIVPMWIRMLVSSIFYNYNFFIAHLVPKSSPEYIAPFLCVSEMLSNLFRGVTLPSRLTLNMICGHLALSLRTLCSDYLYLVSKDRFFLSGAFTSALSVIEVLVCCLQLYILVRLLLVYADEHTPAKV
jgi:F-type H+-transporting ATPase subunit a